MTLTGCLSRISLIGQGKKFFSSSVLYFGVETLLFSLMVCSRELTRPSAINSQLFVIMDKIYATPVNKPILDFFKKRLKFKHTLATIATLFIFILIIAGFVLMFIPLISTQGQNLSLLKTAEIEKNITQL